MASTVQIYYDGGYRGDYFVRNGGTISESATLRSVIARERNVTLNNTSLGQVRITDTSSAVWDTAADWKDYANTSGTEITVYGRVSSLYTNGVTPSKDSNVSVLIKPTNTVSSGKINHPREFWGVTLSGRFYWATGSTNALPQSTSTSYSTTSVWRNTQKDSDASYYKDTFNVSRIQVGRKRDDTNIAVYLGTPFWIVFKPNGGSVPSGSSYYDASGNAELLTKVYSDCQGCGQDWAVLPDEHITRAGYVFDGWDVYAASFSGSTDSYTVDYSRVLVHMYPGVKDVGGIYSNAGMKTIATRTGSGSYSTTTKVSTRSIVAVVARWTPLPAHTVSFSTSPSDIGTPATITTAPTRTEGGVDYYADTSDITIQPQAINGYRLDSVVFYDAANPEVSVGDKTIADGDLSAFVLSSSDRNGRNMLLKFVYTQLEYSVGASVDEASEGKVTASVDQESAHWGDTVTFTATDIAEDYSFAGWYDADGVQQSSEVAYEVTVQGDIALYAKCKVQCSLSLQYNAEEGDDTTSCSLTVDGAAYVPNAPFDVILGESFTYELLLGSRVSGENWCLDCWKDTEENLQMYGAQGAVSPSAPLALVAHLASLAASTKTLTVNTGAPSGSSFERAVPYRRTGSEGAYEWEEVNPYTFAGNIPPATTQHGGPSLMDTPPPGQFSHDFGGGAQYVRISAEPQVWYEDEESETGYSEQSFRGFYDAEGTPISEEASCYLLMAEDREIWAVYGDAAPVSLKILYADADSANSGNIAIVALTDAEGSIDEDKRGATITQGYVATLRAVPKNGYDFIGWYDNGFTAGDAISTDKEFEYTVMSAKTVYAKFAPARDKICRWEGSADNMTMEWTSKVYVSTRPFDPVAARVDAAGYPVDLTVRTYSSPDKINALPVRDHELTRENPLRVESQDGRRLPRMRPERYVQISVKAEHEVDAVTIGTNMAEVN